MKRVLHVVKIMNQGGAETMIMNIYRNIDRTKIQFDFLCMDDNQGIYEEEIKSFGGRIFKVKSPDKGRIRNLYQIYKILKENANIEVIHSHISFYSGLVNYVAYLAKIKNRIVHSHTTNDLREKTLIRKIYNNFCRFMINKFSNVRLACGEKAGEYLFGNNSYEIVKNGIDLEKYTKVLNEEVEQLKKELSITEDDFIIGHVGRFEKVKNHEYFIQFAKTMKGMLKDFKIVLVGSGTEFDSLKNMIREENLEKYFILTGSRKDINVFMNMFNVFVMPSLYEGFPLVVVEALAGDNICYLSNNISKETNIISDRIRFFDILDNGVELANMIMKDKNNYKKIDIEKILIDKGYSIKDMVSKISNIYLFEN